MENTTTQLVQSSDRTDLGSAAIDAQALESSRGILRFSKSKVLRIILLLLVPVAVILGIWFGAMKLADPKPIFSIKVYPVWFAISSDARLVAASTEPNEKPGAIVNDLVTGRPRGTLLGHGRWTRCGAFSADGGMLATGSEDFTAKLWDTNTGRELATLDANGNSVRSVAFSCDGTRLATGADGTIIGAEVKLWDVATGQLTATISCDGLAESLAFSPDGTTLAVANGEVLLVDVAAGKPIAKLSGSGSITCVAFSPDGRILATGEQGGKYEANQLPSDVRLWDMSTRSEQAVFKGHSNRVSALSFSPDGKTLASASWDGNVILWNLKTGAREATIAGHAPPLHYKAIEAVHGYRPSSLFYVQSVVFSRDGKRIAIAHEDGIVDVWDRETVENLSRQSR